MTSVDLAKWLDVLACPVCMEGLRLEAERLLRCAACGRRLEGETGSRFPW